MKTKISTLLGAALSLLVTFGGTQIAGAQDWQVYFEDNFDGSVIDGSKWNTELATAGKRLCEFAINLPPLVWQDISVDPFYGVTETPPYGAITVAGGFASFSAGHIRAFPYIWCGPPSRSSPFPATGDFIYEFRWRLDSPGQHGDGVLTPFWPNTEPEGDNNPFGLSSWGLWGTGVWSIDSPAGLVTVLEPQVFHTFRLEYINGSYSQYVDGVLSAGPTESSGRPNVIWIGNPVFAWWSQASDDWADFTIDYIRVLVPTNSPPVANDDFYGLSQAGSLSVPAPGILANDNDPDNNPLTAALVTGPTHATSFQLNQNGSFTYLPPPYFYGEDTFTYRANDGTAHSQVVTVHITVSPPGSAGFITGGGNFFQNGRKCTFGFVAKVQGNGVQGNLEYQDHDASMDVRSQAMQVVYAANSIDGYFGGTCRLNDVAGYTFFVQIYDRGEPGRNDDFAVWIFDSFNNPVYSAGGLLSGGNIVIH